MAIEVSCGNCHERLISERPGDLIACPHCGANLIDQISDQDITPLPDEEIASPDTIDVQDDLTEALNPPAVIAQILAQQAIVGELQPPTTAQVPDMSWMTAITPPTPANYNQRFIEPHLPSLNRAGVPMPPTPPHGDDPAANNFHFDPSNDSDEVPHLKSAGAENLDASTTPHTYSPLPRAIKPESTITLPNVVPMLPAFPDGPNPAKPVTFTRQQASSRETLLSMLLIIVGTYASLLTIYVIYSLLFSRTHQLESLPDLKTVQQMGGKAVIPGPANRLPPGHELKLGQSRRYGNIRVTPIQVTRGPLIFTHFSGDATRERLPSNPVLKLWLKFENVSSKQTIVPIDSTLMYFHLGIGRGEIASYNSIFSAAGRNSMEHRVYYHFDRIAADSEWLIVGQNANHSLGPGEVIETFVPSEENIDGLTGEIVWRVHMRKGHGPKSGNGVTTLIDVRFKADDIKSDPVRDAPLNS